MSQLILSGLISIWLLLILIHLFQNLQDHIVAQRVVDYCKCKSVAFAKKFLEWFIRGLISSNEARAIQMIGMILMILREGLFL